MKVLTFYIRLAHTNISQAPFRPNLRTNYSCIVRGGFRPRSRGVLSFLFILIPVLSRIRIAIMLMRKVVFVYKGSLIILQYVKMRKSKIFV